MPDRFGRRHGRCVVSAAATEWAVVWPTGQIYRSGFATEAAAYEAITAYESQTGTAPGIDHGFGAGSGMRVAPAAQALADYLESDD